MTVAQRGGKAPAEALPAQATVANLALRYEVHLNLLIN
jgi:hypothetical protein